MHPHWLPVVGGPDDGCEFYPPDDPKPGGIVIVRERNEVLRSWQHDGVYRYSADCRKVVWFPRRRYERF